MKVNYIRKISAVLLAAVLLVSFVFAATAEVDAASKTKKMKTYKVIARGNTAYCAAYSGIYKVDLITRKSTRLVYGGLDESPVDIRKKGAYIYYNYLTALGNVLGRVNINTKKYK